MGLGNLDDETGEAVFEALQANTKLTPDHRSLPGKPIYPRIRTSGINVDVQISFRNDDKTLGATLAVLAPVLAHNQQLLSLSLASEGYLPLRLSLASSSK